MNEKQVPEELRQFIEKKLLGNKAFGRLRGAFKVDSTLGILDKTLDESKTPTQFCNDWDQTSSDIRVIGNIISQCRRNGHDVIADEIVKALSDRAYTLPGETIPIEQTQPITILVIDFERTLTMIKWIRCAHWMELRNFVRDEKEQIWETGDNLTNTLFKQYPSLYDFTISGLNDGYEGPELRSAYRQDVYDKIHNMALRDSAKIGLKFHTYNSHLEINDLMFAHVFFGDQAEVLANFTRHEQRLLSTWTVNVPSVLIKESGLSKLMFGFHPEDKHSFWKNASNCSNSIGCVNGYGVVALNEKYTDPFTDHTGRIHSQYSISNLDIEDPDEKIAFELT